MVMLGVLGAGLLLVPRFGRVLLPLALAAPVGIVAGLAWLAPGVLAGAPVAQHWGWIAPLDLTLDLRLDGLGLLFALLIAGIGVLIVCYAGGYLHGHPQRARFLAYLLLFMASMLGVVLADNVLFLFVCWELTSFTSYLLIGFDHEREAARKAALQALLVTGLGGLALLIGLLAIGQAVGSMRLSDILASGDLLRDHPRYPWMLALVLLGAFTKSAQVPFHFWLPNAMQAPTPASAYLHSSTMVKAGVYLLARFQPVLGGTEPWLIAVGGIGALTLLTGAVLALGQTPMKRLLAYTTVAALGGMTLMLGLGAPAAEAAMIFLLAHALYKAALFMVAGAVDHATGERDVTQLGGLARAMPWTAAAAVVAAFSMAGLPPAFGFVAKESLLAAVSLPVASVIIIGGALMLAVAALTGVRPFFAAAPRATPRQAHEAPWSMRLGPLVLGVLTLALGLIPGWADGLIAAAAGAVAGGPVPTHLALWHGWTPALGLSAITVVLGLLVLRGAGWGRALAARGASLARRWGPEAGYQAALGGLTGFARFQTRLLQNGSLSRYLQITVLTLCTLAVLAFWRGGVTLPALVFSDVNLPKGALVLLVILAAVAAVFSSSRLGAVAAMGVVGFSVALLFIHFGAPDLAMTQLVIEALTVVLLVSAFYHLPPFESRSPRRRLLRDGAISLIVGGVMTVLTLAATGIQLAPPISDYYAATSVPLGKGRNIVNVILVDYRGLDTLGEITVLAVAALGAFALLKLRLGGERRRRKEDACPL